MAKPSNNEYLNYKPTREEDFIKFYLDDLNISYTRELEIDNLKWDTKKNRRVDFYLKKLDVYVEYYGLYNSTKEIRKEYDNKTNVYFKNGLATIILYPHELGFLDYAFHTKMVKLFNIEKFRNRKNKFYRYLINRYYTSGKWKYSFNGAFWAYLFIVFSNEMVKLDESLNALFTIICFVLAVTYLFSFLWDLFFFFRNKGVL